MPPRCGRDSIKKTWLYLNRLISKRSLNSKVCAFSRDANQLTASRLTNNFSFAFVVVISDVVLETRVLGFEAPRGQENESRSWSWSWIRKSWSRSWRKSLAVFQDFCCNSSRQWARHTTAFCERQQKQFAIRKPLFERNFCAPCTSASVRRYLTMGLFVRPHRRQ